MKTVIQSKSFLFSLRIVKLSNYLQNTKHEFVMSKQLLRCGTSIGANIFEAQQAQRRAEFISKLSIALKEAVETNYWLRLLHATDYLNEKEFSSLIEDCRELERLLTAVIKSTKL